MATGNLKGEGGRDKMIDGYEGRRLKGSDSSSPGVTQRMQWNVKYP